MGLRSRSQASGRKYVLFDRDSQALFWDPTSSGAQAHEKLWRKSNAISLQVAYATDAKTLKAEPKLEFLDRRQLTVRPEYARLKRPRAVRRSRRHVREQADRGRAGAERLVDRTGPDLGGLREDSKMSTQVKEAESQINRLA